MNTKNVGLIALMIVIAGGSFYGGMSYRSSFRDSIGNQFQGARNGMMQGQRLGGGNGYITGEVISKDATSVTVKLPSGGSSIAFYSEATSIEKTASGSWDDIIAGKTIVIRGLQNSDGTYTAQTIQLSRPPMRPTGSVLPR